MTTKLNFGRDVQGMNAYAPEFATNHYSASLANGDEEKLTVPSNFSEWIVAFSFQPGTNVWVANNATAEVPAGTTFVSTSSELNPGARKVFAGDILSFITNNATADVGVSLYAIS